MIRKMYLPDEVKNAMQAHIEVALAEASSRYYSAYEKEDSLTGLVFRALQIAPQEVEVLQGEIRGTWKWEMDFKTFGSRTAETVIGADGVFELYLRRNGQKEESKSLLFQSKVDWTGRDSKLLDQCIDLLVWRGASTVINYTEEGFETYDLDDVLREDGIKPDNMLPLKDLLGKKFLECEIGDSDLFYDAVKKKLIWYDIHKKYVETKFNMNRRLRATVTAPPWRVPKKIIIDKTIPNEEIYKHLMETNFADKYDPRLAKTPADLKKIKHGFSKVLHPDKRGLLRESQQGIFTILMQEFNARVTQKEEELAEAKAKVKVKDTKPSSQKSRKTKHRL